MIGKTRTVKALARDCLQHYHRVGQKAGAYFVSARQCQSMDPIFMSIRNNMNCSMDEYVIASIRAKTKEEMVVLVIDNIEDLLTNESCKKDFMTFCQEVVEKTNNLKILMTSRQDIMFVRISNKVINKPLPQLPKQAACVLFNHVIDSNNDESSPSETDEKVVCDIIEELGRLPLLIISMGALIRNEDYTPDQLLELLKNTEEAGIVSVASDDRFSGTDRADEILSFFMKRLSLRQQKDLVSMNEIPGAFSLEAARGMTSPDKSLGNKINFIVLIQL